jgi:hypothetical protein
MKFLKAIDLTGQLINNLGDPSAATDAANKQYVDNVARGLVIKDSVRVASTANVTLATPGATLDGVSMVSSDRVLLKNQSTASENGIWIWNGASSAMTRALDADNGTELRPGSTVYSTEGTVNADKAWVITSDAAITIGTTSQTWTQFGGGSAYTGSNGILLTSQNFTGVVVASGGLTVGASGFAIDTSIVARKLSGSMGNGALTTIDVAHNLGTKDVIVQVRANSDDSAVITDWLALDTNTVRFTFATAPTTNQYRWTVIG